MTDERTCRCKGQFAMHKPHPHADRDGSEGRAQLEREHERALAAYVPDDEPGEVERLRAEVARWTEKAQEAGAAYANANTKHHAEWERANRLEGLAERLAERAVELEDRAWKAEAALARVEAALTDSYHVMEKQQTVWTLAHLQDDLVAALHPKPEAAS